MPSTRLAPSRTVAKASGRILSSDSPAATRCLNSSVLPRSASSLSFSNSDSSALIRATVLDSWRSTRSLRLPKRLVKARLNIDLPDLETGTPGSDECGRDERNDDTRVRRRSQLAAFSSGWGGGKVERFQGLRRGSAHCAPCKRSMVNGKSEERPAAFCSFH